MLKKNNIERRETRIVEELNNEFCYAIRLFREQDGSLHGYRCSKCGGGWSIYTSQPTCYCGEGPLAHWEGRIRN